MMDRPEWRRKVRHTATAVFHSALEKQIREAEPVWYPRKDLQVRVVVHVTGQDDVEPVDP